MSHSSIRASVETCPPKLHNLFQFSLPFHPEPEILWASPPRASRVSAIHVFLVYRVKLRLIVMSTNLKYRVRERQRKRESRWQASEARREKGRQGSRARGHFFVARTT